MSADYVLYAVRPDEWPEWQRLREIEVWSGNLAEEDRAHGLKAGDDTDWDSFRVMVDRFHEEGRSCFIAEVSFLKAGLFDGVRHYVPGAVLGVKRVMSRRGDQPLVTSTARAITVALNAPNRSIYRHRGWYWIPRHPISREGWHYRRPYRGSGVARGRDVKRWLAAHLDYYLSDSAE